MAKRVSTDLGFAFFGPLRDFYLENRRHVRSLYKDLSKKFLDFNDPKDNVAFLREPQFEALEMYIFLKEFCNNAPVHRLFRDWFEKKDLFERRTAISSKRMQATLFDTVTELQYENLYKRMQKNSRKYSNYIYALTMELAKRF